MFYHTLHFIVSVGATGVLHPIRGDNKDGFCRTIFFTGIFVNVSDVVDSTTDCVQKGCASAYPVLLISHRFDFLNVNTVIDYLVSIREQDGGKKRLALLLLLLFHHGVEAADSVILKPCHRAAAIQDEYDFSQIVVHSKYPFPLLWPYHTAKERGFGQLTVDLLYFETGLQKRQTAIVESLVDKRYIVDFPLNVVLNN